MANKKPRQTPLLGSQLTAIMSVALLLLLLGVMGISLLSARQYANSLRRDLALIVKIEPGTEAKAVNALRREVNKASYVSSYAYTSADMVLAQEVALMGTDMAELLDENPYSDELELHLVPECLNADSIAVIKKRLEKNEIVEEVVTDATLAAGVDTFIRRASMIAAVVGAVLLLISFVLINNTVSLAIYSRRFIIRTMHLVGASPGFIRAPFVRAGMLSGLIAGVIASALIGVMVLTAYDKAPEIAVYIDVTDVIIVCCCLLVTGPAICAIAAAWSANRYLRRSYDQLYRK